MSGPDEDDDEALRWAGDDERGVAAPRRGAPTSARRDDAVDDEPEPPAPGRRGRTAAAAFFLPLYLLAAIGWVLGIQWTSSGTTNLGTEVLWQFGEFLAIVAAPLWFVAATRMTATSRPLVRVGWLALGIGLLVPWPLVLGVIGELS